MSQSLPPKSSLWPLLFQIDVEFRDKKRVRGCPHCGGRLDCANYPRKPRGGPETSSKELTVRLGLCCSAEGCRRRATPTSVRFLDRRVYLGVIIVLVGALRQGPTPTRMKTISEALGVCRRTVERWGRWWRANYATSAVWRELRGRLALPEEPMPRRLVRAFAAEHDPTAQARALCALADPSAPITVSEGI